MTITEFIKKLETHFLPQYQSAIRPEDKFALTGVILPVPVSLRDYEDDIRQAVQRVLFDTFPARYLHIDITLMFED